MLTVDIKILLEIFKVIDEIDDRVLILQSIYQNLVNYFNNDIQNGFYPETILLKSLLDKDPISLETIEKQNLLLNYLYNAFQEENMFEYCEQLNYIKNIINSRN